ncbi:major histocompatibility complex class I-related gene protein-like isoform X2 [Leuresthes tenuis]|uniref:major histocompatibility complex class I-related gene protein-like isoform X2 n=1 Tax=Leuresthes tenuis TaxID=355514 RepID=UPI003B508C47
MKSFIFIFLFGIHSVSAVTHSLQYFYTGSSGIPGFPEFVSVGMLDGQPFTYYDSVLKKETPKQDWMAQKEGPEYWERQTQTLSGAEQTFKGNIQIAKQRFNQTGGVHIVQNMYGCEWDDETDKVVKVYNQHGYDGEDFLSLDLQTETWTAPNTQAFITKQKLDHNKALMAQKKNYLTQICPEWLKKYVNHGRSSLMRTEPPSVSLLQKTPSSAVSCHATGFYPNRAELLWRRDGEEVHEGVVKGEILPNNDGTFQMSANLKLSSVPTEDWMKYECVFQLSGAEDLITKLEKTKIRSNTGFPAVVVIGVLVGVLVLACVVSGVVYCKKGNHAKLPLSEKSKTSSTESLPSPKLLTEESCTSSRDSDLSSAGSAHSDTPLMKRRI